MKRRDVLTAAPVAALTAALCAGDVAAATEAVLATETPVKAAYREWLAYRNWLNVGTDGMDDSDFDDLCDVRRGMEAVIYDMPTKNPADVLLKLLVLNDNGNDFSDDAFETGRRMLTEARALLGEV